MSDHSIYESRIANFTDMIHHYQSVETSLRESQDINTTILQKSLTPSMSSRMASSAMSIPRPLPCQDIRSKN